MTLWDWKSISFKNNNTKEQPRSDEIHMGGKIMKRIQTFDTWKGILTDNKNIFVKFQAYDLTAQIIKKKMSKSIWKIQIKHQMPASA